MWDKIGLIALTKSHGNQVVCFSYIKGTTQENLDKLIQNVQIESDSDMIRNWKYLDVPIISSVRFFFFKFPTIQALVYSSFSNS